MSVERYRDSLLVPIPVTVYAFSCDAEDCWNSCELMVNDGNELVRIDDMMADSPLTVSDEDEARMALLENTEWAGSAPGIPRLGTYCPKHRTTEERK